MPMASMCEQVMIEMKNALALLADEMKVLPLCDNLIAQGFAREVDRAYQPQFLQEWDVAINRRLAHLWITFLNPSHNLLDTEMLLSFVDDT
jgi:hypothetical protein